MADRKQLNVDMTKHQRLYEKVSRVAKKIDIDASKLTRFALKVVVSKIESGEIKVEEIDPEKAL